MAFDQFEIQEHDEDGHFHNAYIDFMQSNQQFDDFLEKKKEKRKKKKEATLDDFTEENILRDDIEMKDDYESGTTNTGMDARDN
jgi:propanediol dehydratase small subunit